MSFSSSRLFPRSSHPTAPSFSCAIPAPHQGPSVASIPSLSRSLFACSSRAPSLSRSLPPQRPRRQRRAPDRDLEASLSTRDFPFGTLFSYPHDGGYLVRLSGMVEKTQTAWIGCLSPLGELESFQGTSLTYLRTLPRPDVVPFPVSKAVAELFENPTSIFRYNRAPRRPPRLPRPPPSPLRLDSRLRSLQELLGPLTCPIAPSPSLEAIFASSPGFPAPPAQIRHLHNWGILGLPEARHPAACVIFSAVESAVYDHRLRAEFSVSRDDFVFTPDDARRQIHGIDDPCPCLWKSSSAHLLHLSTRTRVSRLVEQTLFALPPTSSQALFLNSLPGERFAHEMTCQGVSLHPATTLVSTILRTPALLRVIAQRPGGRLNVVSNFSGLELTLSAFDLCNQPISLRGACDRRKRLRSFYEKYFPDADFQTCAEAAALQPYLCDVYLSGASLSPCHCPSSHIPLCFTSHLLSLLTVTHPRSLLLF